MRTSRIVGIAFIILALVSGGIWLYGQRSVPMASEPSITLPDPTVTVTPSLPPSSSTPTPVKPVSFCGQDPKGKPSQIIVKHGKTTLISASLKAGGEDANGVWQADPGTSSWLKDAGRPAPGVRDASLRSVVTAHVRYGGKPDVFSQLRDVRKGDVVYVIYTSKDVATFRISDNPRGFSKQQMVKQDAYWDLTSPGCELTLITCDQTSVVRPDGHLSDNLAVRATRIK